MDMGCSLILLTQARMPVPHDSILCGGGLGLLLLLQAPELSALAAQLRTHLLDLLL
jgi:hypothetical protein